MWLAIVRLTKPLLTSFPMPRPGIAVSFAMTVRFFFPWRTSSSMMRSGVPTPMKPPIMSVAPSEIIVTASSTGTVFMVQTSVSCVFFTRKQGQSVGTTAIYFLSPKSTRNDRSLNRFECDAIPCPPPIHNATIPRLMPSRCIECRSRVVRTAPVAPIG